MAESPVGQGLGAVETLAQNQHQSTVLAEWLLHMPAMLHVMPPSSLLFSVSVFTLNLSYKAENAPQK